MPWATPGLQAASRGLRAASRGRASGSASGSLLASAPGARRPARQPTLQRLLCRRSELHGALRAAYFGPRLELGQGQLPDCFEGEERSPAVDTPDLLALVFGRRVLGAVQERTPHSLTSDAERGSELPGGPGALSALSTGEPAVESSEGGGPAQRHVLAQPHPQPGCSARDDRDRRAEGAASHALQHDTLDLIVGGSLVATAVRPRRLAGTPLAAGVAAAAGSSGGGGGNDGAITIYIEGVRAATIEPVRVSGRAASRYMPDHARILTSEGRHTHTGAVLLQRSGHLLCAIRHSCLAAAAIERAALLPACVAQPRPPRSPSPAPPPLPPQCCAPPACWYATSPS